MCYNCKTSMFIEKAQKIHGKEKFNFHKTQYELALKKVLIGCLICGKDFWMRPNNILNGQQCPHCNGNPRLTIEQFINRSVYKHGQEFNYDKSECNGAHKKILIRHNKCGNYFWQTAKQHMDGHKCPLCWVGRKLTTEQFILRAITIHGDLYDYSLVDYKGNKIKIKIKCKFCGRIFMQKPNSHLNGNGCIHKNVWNKTISSGHAQIALFVKQNYKKQIIINDRKTIKRKNYLQLDLFFPDIKLAIEYNGQYWHKQELNQNYKENEKYIKCKEKGIQLVFVWQKDWLENKEKIKKQILKIINERTKKIFK